MVYGVSGNSEKKIIAYGVGTVSSLDCLYYIGFLVKGRTNAKSSAPAAGSGGPWSKTIKSLCLTLLRFRCHGKE